MAIGVIKKTRIRLPDVDWEDRSVRIKVGNVKPAPTELPADPPDVERT